MSIQQTFGRSVSRLQASSVSSKRCPPFIRQNKTPTSVSRPSISSPCTTNWLTQPARYQPFSKTSAAQTGLSVPASPTSTQAQQPTEQPGEQAPSYELTFTCRPCGTRSSNHKIAKRTYHHGSVLITCPGCKARHVITDHLKIFGSTDFNIEDYLKEHGGLMKKGHVEGDMEIWDDGTMKDRPRAQ